VPLGVVSGVGRGMGVLEGGGDHRSGGGNLGVNVGHLIVTNNILCVRGGDAALPKLLWNFLLLYLLPLLLLLKDSPNNNRKKRQSE